MGKILERVVKSSGSPNTNDLWLDDDNNLKVYDNAEWKPVAGGASSDNSSSGTPGVINVTGVLNGAQFTPILDVESGKQEDTSAQAALWNEVADAFKNGATVNLVSDGNYFRVISLENVTSNDITIQLLVVFSMNSISYGEGGVCGWINPGTMPSPSE